SPIDNAAFAISSGSFARYCRFHGARGGGPKGERNGMYRHGLNTKEAKEERRLLLGLLRQSQEAIAAQSNDAGDVGRAGKAATPTGQDVGAIRATNS
ncbi:MAG TPA: hypothetical protein VIH87_15300, partial [Methylocella sp.]